MNVCYFLFQSNYTSLGNQLPVFSGWVGFRVHGSRFKLAVEGSRMRCPYKNETPAPVRRSFSEGGRGVFTGFVYFVFVGNAYMRSLHGIGLAHTRVRPCRKKYRRGRPAAGTCRGAHSEARGRSTPAVMSYVLFLIISSG